jgi:hypothetical protein
MADTTILNGDIGVTWLDNNRSKYLEWLGGTNDNYTMNQLYSAMQTLQDESTTIDDGACFFADTPTEYTIGKIDQGDNDPWYIQFDLMEKITGGALRTTGWQRVTSTNTGIICVPVDSGGTIVAADEGFTVSGATDGSGTLLEFIDTQGTLDYLIIRPDDDTAASDFTTVDQVITSSRGAFTAVQWDNANSTTGEMVWANVYSIGTIEPSVHMYIYQGAALTTDARDRVYSWNSATLDWYTGGHIDTTVALKNIESTTWDIIDGGYVNVYARKGGDFYSSFEVQNSITSGGRNPAPINTSVDADQSHGTKSVSFVGAVSGGPFVDGEIIRDTTTNGRGILDLTNSTVTSGGELVYFPISEDDGTGTTVGGALTAIGNGNTVQGATSSASVTTNGAPADDGAASSAWFTSATAPTISFTATLADIDNDSIDEYYGIVVDCNANPLTEVYQWLKYIAQYGITTGDIATAESGIDGQEYIGATAYFEYTSITGTIGEGESVTQATSGATGVILSHDTTNNIVLLRSTRGAFQDGLQIDADDDADFFGAASLVAANFAANTASPFGTLPGGGTFFGARGVLIQDYLAADENKFSLIDIEGVTNVRPQSITLEISNLVGAAESSNEGDLATMFRLTGAGGDIDKTEYDVTGTPAAGDATLAVSTAITDDTVASGRLVILVDPGLATAQEYTVRFSSWATSTFTLANTTGTCDDVGSSTTATNLNDSGASFNTTARRGDLVYTAKGIGYVQVVVSDTVLTLVGAGITGLVATDAYELNAVPVALDSGDDVYVPFINRYASSSEESASIIYLAQIFYRVKVRNTRNTTTKIRPYSSDGNTSGTYVNVKMTRNEDTIIT